MQKKTIWITSGAIAAALVLGGVGVAVADPFDDDRDSAGGALTSGSTGTTDDRGQRTDVRFDDDGVDDRSDDGYDDNDDLSGTDLERASAAAVIATDGGRVTGAESSGSSNHAYEVDVLLDDGRDVDVYLDADFGLLGVESSDDRRDDDGRDDTNDDDDRRGNSNDDGGRGDDSNDDDRRGNDD